MSKPTSEDRATFAAALRELADLVDANPAVPIPKYATIDVHAGNVDAGVPDDDEGAKRAFVDRAAEALGTVASDHGGRTHYKTEWVSSGPELTEYSFREWGLTYAVVTVDQASQDRHAAQNSYSQNIVITA